MKMNLAERIKLARKLAGISQKKLGEIIGVSQAAIQKIETGLAQNSTKLIDIAVALNVRPEWLAFGVEPMSRNLPIINREESSIPPQSQWRGVDVWDSDTPLSDDEVEIPYFKSIELAAGHGCVNNEDHNGFKLRFSKSTLRRAGADPACTIAFPVHGHSMEPVIPEGTTVTVDLANKRIVDGAIYAIDHGDLLRVKQLFRMPNKKLSIRSYNKIDFPDEEADQDSVEIIGRVIHYSVMLI